MHRRSLIAGGVATLLATQSLLSRSAVAAPVSADLLPTDTVDAAHPDVVAAALRLTAGAQDARERAVRVHDFVRDRVHFGWVADDEQKASAVLHAPTGCCRTKSTLFVAMLRASGVPARQRFVDIDHRLLADYLDPGTPYVDHVLVEVWLGRRWIALDSHVVDRPLAEQARAQLAREDRSVGYGVHRNGTSDWDGRGPAFAQRVDDGSMPRISRRDHGIHRDVVAFHRSGWAWNRRGPALRVLYRIAARTANAKVARMRGGARR